MTATKVRKGKCRRLQRFVTKRHKLSVLTSRHKRASFTIAFKKEVIAFMDEGNSPYRAWKYFSNRDNTEYDHSIFYQWKKRREDISITGATKKRSVGRGRKPKLEDIEDILADEIINLWLQKLKVTRTFIRKRAKQMAEEANIGEEFKI